MKIFVVFGSDKTKLWVLFSCFGCLCGRVVYKFLLLLTFILEWEWEWERIFMFYSFISYFASCSDLLYTVESTNASLTTWSHDKAHNSHIQFIISFSIIRFNDHNTDLAVVCMCSLKIFLCRNIFEYFPRFFFRWKLKLFWFSLHACC